MENKPPAPKKRSLFTQAALSKKTQAVADNDLIFSRAKELEAERLAEEERLRQKRINKAERKRSAQATRRPVDSETPPKKRKISPTVEALDGNGSESSGLEEPEEPRWATRNSTVSSSPGSSKKPPPGPSHNKDPPLSPSTTLSARYSKSLQQSKESKDQPKSKGYISITDSDDSEGPAAVLVQRQANQPIAIDDDDEVVCISRKPVPEPRDEDRLFDDDEEFPELVERARERERLRLLQAANSEKSFSEKNHSQDSYDAFTTEGPKDIDPSIEILITSTIENTIPLKVKRKLSHRLKEARFAWCDRQNLTAFSSMELRNSIFLTWKHKRLFDYTSCRALGLKLDDLGLLEDEGLYEGKVHLEAWTEETYEAAQKEEEAARRREELGESEEEPEVQEEVVKVRLVMTARDMDPVKLVAKGDTSIEKLIMAFRTARKIPDEKVVSLWLDGEQLDSEDVVGDTELEDMDNIEVHIK